MCALAVGEFPPAKRAEVPDPLPAASFLAVDKSPTSVQPVPSQNSVIATTDGDCPPTVIAKAVVPEV